MFLQKFPHCVPIAQVGDLEKCSVVRERKKRTCLPNIKHFVMYTLTVLSMGLIFVISWSVMDGMILLKPNFKDNFEGEIFLQKEPLAKLLLHALTSAYSLLLALSEGEHHSPGLLLDFLWLLN